ncbi:PAS domain S-box protein, partial [Sphingobacteriales bacterium CHB3]|nr:PAS domain S-box protein [Sphingobacteriales bacterium CHB3]
EDGSWRAIETLISPQEYLIHQGRPVIINDVQTNDDWKIYTPGDELIHSWLGIPLIHRDVLLGVLNLDHHDIGFFTEDYAQLAYAVAQQAGIAIANAQLFENLEELVRTRTQELAVEKERSDIILHYIADAIVFTDDKGYILYVNPAWEKLNGYTLDEVWGRRSNLIQSGETPLAVYQAMWNAITSGKTWKGDLKNRRKDGSLYVAELVIVPVHSAEGNIQHYVGVQRDVTALRELDALKERFVADAAHDLGNPVAVLNTSLYMLRHAPAQLEQRLPILEYQVKRLDALVKDLLTISQLDREVDLVIVGADRIAANGDTANKIGTYVLAVLARQHGVPFYVAAPTTTIDFKSRNGRNIPIEERDPRDVTHIGNLRIAAEGVGVFAPAFDVTPNEFIHGIVTEVGVLRPPFVKSIAALRTDGGAPDGNQPAVPRGQRA